jgi:hypothetical protein
MLKQFLHYPKATLVALFLFIAVASQAQYHAAVGGKFAKFGSGISGKYFFWPDNATGVELVIGRTEIANRGWFVTAFYENQIPFQIPIIQLPLDLICGIGGHVNYYPKRYYKIVEGQADYYHDKCIAVGVDVLVGVEYLSPIDWLPLVVGIEAQPFIEFVNKGPEFLDAAITLRYFFNP